MSCVVVDVTRLGAANAQSVEQGIRRIKITLIYFVASFDFKYCLDYFVFNSVCTTACACGEGWEKGKV